MNSVKYQIIVLLVSFLLQSCVKDNNPEIIEKLFFTEHDNSEIPENQEDPDTGEADYKIYDVFKSDQRQNYVDDDFTTSSSVWSEISSGLFTATIGGGHYLLTNNNSNGIVHQASVGDLSEVDFEIEYRVKRIDTKAFNNVGFIWGSSVSPLNFYYMILSDQYGLSVDVGEYNGNKETWYVSSSLDDFSVEGYGYNKYTIRRVADKYYFFVNEVFFYEGEVKSFFGNRIGIYMGNYSKATFDQIKIDKLVNL